MFEVGLQGCCLVLDVDRCKSFPGQYWVFSLGEVLVPRCILLNQRGRLCLFGIFESDMVPDGTTSDMLNESSLSRMPNSGPGQKVGFRWISICMLLLKPAGVLGTKS